MRYVEYRLAKRDGTLVQQRRYFTVEVKPTFKWWQLWKWGQYESYRKYGKWEDMPFVEL